MVRIRSRLIRFEGFFERRFEFPSTFGSDSVLEKLLHLFTSSESEWNRRPRLISNSSSQNSTRALPPFVYANLTPHPHFKFQTAWSSSLGLLLVYHLPASKSRRLRNSKSIFGINYLWFFLYIKKKTYLLYKFYFLTNIRLAVNTQTCTNLSLFKKSKVSCYCIKLLKKITISSMQSYYSSGITLVHFISKRKLL